ncbi:MarR family winged helix-turn-helix transcriptional regulator [Desulfitibacter alkalitolerans]|uniref:MarR family winged helix-turn-helix transcriptional regulator n=1 Tax=Desulfitibacter alkalitolerans TaxID=264641 RepID=UPI000488C1C9|nr:MarR family transcriptional regulator [Desulfitibacter alkalitolerans]
MDLKNLSILDKEKFIFGSIFLLSNKLQVIGDQYLGKDGMTLRQWFLTVMILQFGDRSPTLGEVAELMGSSHQNVKQLALKLQEKDFLRIEKDEQDGRAIRLKLTNKSYEYWKNREEEGELFIKKLFQDLNQEETHIMWVSFKKLLYRIDNWGE